MTRSPKKCCFADAVLGVLEGATLIKHNRQEWFSATFVGERHSLTLRLTGADAALRAEAFAKAIAEHEFALPRRCVADVVVSGIAADWDGADILIEALVLEE